MPGQKSFIGNKRTGFYTDKYGMYMYVLVIWLCLNMSTVPKPGIYLKILLYEDEINYVLSHTANHYSCTLE